MSLRVRLTPKSSADRIESVADTAAGPALKARVRAVPEDGKAAAEAPKALARALGGAKSRLTLVRGGRPRAKLFRLD